MGFLVKNYIFFSDFEKKCKLLISSIPIVHIYGNLGPLPWQEPDESDKTVPYGGTVNPEHLSDCAQRIIILNLASGGLKRYCLVLIYLKKGLLWLKFAVQTGLIPPMRMMISLLLT